MEAQLYPHDLQEAAVPSMTTAAITKYVDTAGSDVTGNGTAGLPYATVERACEDLPGWPRPVIRHACKILVDGGNYASGWPKSLAPIFLDDGSLEIVGVGVPVVVSGPHAVTGVADLGTGGQRVTVGAGGLGAVDSLCGQMVMIATGGHPNQGHMVVANTDTTIDLVLVTDKVHNADTFNLVNPAAKIAADSAVIKQDNLAAPDWNGGTWISNVNRLVIHNIWLDLTASSSASAVMRLLGDARNNSEGIELSFVRIDLPATIYGGIHTAGVQINVSGVQSSAFATDGATGITNLSGDYQVGVSITHTGDREARAIYTYGDNRLMYACVKGWIYSNDAGRLSAGMLGVGQISGGGFTQFNNGVVVGKSTKIALSFDLCNAHIRDIHILNGTCALKLVGNAKATLEGVTCDATLVTGSAVDMGDSSSLILIGAHANFVGATGARAAYRFIAPAVDIDGPAWPAVGAGATDAMGSFINRRS